MAKILNFKESKPLISLFLLALNISYCSPSPRLHSSQEISKVLKNIRNCHIHIVFDKLDLQPPPDFQSPITLRQMKRLTNVTNPAPKNAMINDIWKSSLFPNSIRLNVHTTKGLDCIFILIYFEHERITWTYDNYYRETLPKFQALEEAMYEVDHRFYAENMSPFCSQWNWGKCSGFVGRHLENHFILLISPLNKMEFEYFVEFGKLYSYSHERVTNNFAVRFLGSGSRSAEKSSYFICRYCGEVPQLILMSPESQESVTSFKRFIKPFYSKEWKLGTMLKVSRPEKFHIKNHEVHPLKSGAEEPFNFNLHIIALILQKDNSTLEICNFSPTTFGLNCYPETTVFKKPTIYSANVLASATSERAIILISTDPFKFLTCYSNPTLSFSIYAKPFQFELWIGFFLNLIILAVLLHLFINYSAIQNKDFLSSFSPYFFMLSTIVEESISVPKIIWDSQPFRIGMGLWLLISVIFTNAYIGLSISDLTSPLPLQSISEFQDLVRPLCPRENNCNQTEWASIIRTYFNKSMAIKNWDVGAKPEVWEHRKFDPDSDFKLLSNLQKSAAEENRNGIGLGYVFELAVSNWEYTRFNEEKYFYRNRDKEIFQNATRVDFLLFTLYNPRSVFPPRKALELTDYLFESAIEEEIVDCGRTALVDFQPNIISEFKYLSTAYPGIKFFVSDESILNTFIAWSFSPSGESRVPQYFQILVHSGIYYKLNEYAQSRKLSNRLNFTLKNFNPEKWLRVKPMNLFGSIQTVFFIFILMLAVSTCCFITEKIWMNRVFIYFKICSYFRNIQLQLLRYFKRKTCWKSSVAE